MLLAGNIPASESLRLYWPDIARCWTVRALLVVGTDWKRVEAPECPSRKPDIPSEAGNRAPECQLFTPKRTLRNTHLDSVSMSAFGHKQTFA